MRFGTTRSETRARRRAASRQITLYTAGILVLLLVTAAFGYLARGVEPAVDVPAGVPLDGVVRLEVPGATGSGFLVTERYVLTAAHVVGDTGAPVQATFDDGRVVGGSVVASGYPEYREFEQGATVTGGATPHDWALVELDQPQDPVLIFPFGDPTTLSDGADEVLAIGYPGGAERNVSKGVISRREADEIRTDAGIDPGYSGGPLWSIDQFGAVGIIVSVPQINGAPSDAVRNAVPIDLAIEKIEAAGISIQ